MVPLLHALRAFFTSLRLTVTLLVFSILLVWLATWMQQYYGIHYIEQEYFHSILAPIRAPGWAYAIPLPGGYLLGWLLFVNLLTSQIVRIPWRWNKVGLHLSHAGILLLLLGEFFRGVGTEESQMSVDEGGTSNYAESIHEREVAITDVTDPTLDVVTAIPLRRLVRGETITVPNSPLTVVPKEFFGNANLAMRRDAPNAPANPATAGVGPQVVVMPARETFRSDEINLPTGYVEIRADGVSQGIWLVSLMLERPQPFTHAGRRYEIALRRTRHYLDFSLTLLDFRHDKYPGTEIPKNFSSQVRVRSEDGRENREVKIYMNNPLRLRGLTFFQASFANNDTTSIFQVVRNPGWRIPYIACVIAGLGLAVHFLLSLERFLSRPRSGAKESPAAPATASTP